MPRKATDRFLEEGMDGHISKPAQEGELGEVLTMCFVGAQQRAGKETCSL